MTSWDYVGTARKDTIARYARHRLAAVAPEQVYRFQRTCIMHLYRKRLGHADPACCCGTFWTNRSTKLTCSAECSMDWGQIAGDLRRKQPEAVRLLTAQAMGDSDAEG
jgi:hypothetical protein